ncbi:MAG: hypothetical protein OHK0026_03330 [Rhodocyclaceae bacterium]
MAGARVLHLNSAPEAAQRVGSALSGAAPGGRRFHLVSVESREELERALEGCGFDCVLAGLEAAGFGGEDVLDAVRAKCPGACIVVLARHGGEESALAALSRGAEDYVLDHPEHLGRLPWVIAGAIQRSRTRAGAGKSVGAALMRRDLKALTAAREDLERAKENFTRLTERLLGVQEKERAQLSRELHDEIGQSLGALNVLLAEARARVTQARSELPWKQAAGMIDEALGVTARLLGQVRDIAHGLRPAELDALCLAAAVRCHAETHLGRAGIVLSLAESLGEGRLPAAVELGSFRIVQEAITNVLRHAGAAHVEIELAREAGALSLSVRDDGRGFDPAAVGSGEARFRLGLLGMNERAAALGGSLAILSSPGAGTVVSARIPIPGQES